MAHGYYVQAFRFLLKPINVDLFEEAFCSALENLQQSSKILVTNQRGQIIPLKIDDIIYFEAGDRKSGVRTMDNFYEIHKNLKEIFPMLDKQFYYVHRSYIVNLNYIEKIEDLKAVMSEGSIISISRLKKADFYKRFFDFVKRKSWNDHSV